MRRGVDRESLGLQRHETDRPAPQNALLVEPKQVFGQRHALGKLRLGDDAIGLEVEARAAADGRHAETVVCPEHDGVLQILRRILEPGWHDHVAGAVAVAGSDDRQQRHRRRVSGELDGVRADASAGAVVERAQDRLVGRRGARPPSGRQAVEQGGVVVGVRPPTIERAHRERRKRSDQTAASCSPFDRRKEDH